MAKTATKPKAAAELLPLKIVEIPLHDLSLSPLNVRQTPPGELATLAENIAANGLRQNLTVITGGSREAPFEVIAGGRRLLALQMLAADGRIPNDYGVSCALAATDAATALSLAENQQREALHPVDEALAFARLTTDEKMKPAAIAVLYGVTKRYVAQRLALASLPALLLNAARESVLSLDQLQAFTVTDDAAKQLEVWKQIEGNPSAYHAAEIRDLLNEELIDSDDRLVKYVGLDAYREAGGTFAVDLFSDDDAPTLLRDGALLKKLVEKQLRKEAKKHAGQGWKWVEVTTNYGTNGGARRVFAERRPMTAAEATEVAALQAEENKINDQDTITDAEGDRLDAIAQRLEAIEETTFEFSAEQKAIAGVLLYVDYRGLAVADEGVVLPADCAALNELTAAKRGEDMKAGAAKREAATRHDDEEEEPAAPPKPRGIFLDIADARMIRTEIDQAWKYLLDLDQDQRNAAGNVITALGRARDNLDLLLLVE